MRGILNRGHCLGILSKVRKFYPQVRKSPQIFLRIKLAVFWKGLKNASLMRVCI